MPEDATGYVICDENFVPDQGKPQYDNAKDTTDCGASEAFEASSVSPNPYKQLGGRESEGYLNVNGVDDGTADAAAPSGAHGFQAPGSTIMYEEPTPVGGSAYEDPVVVEAAYEEPAPAEYGFHYS